MKYTFTKKIMKGCCCQVGGAFYTVEQADKGGYNLQISTIYPHVDKFHFYKLFELEEKMLSIQPDKRKWKITTEATKKAWLDYLVEGLLGGEV